jgi:hypothetical protein
MNLDKNGEQKLAEMSNGIDQKSIQTKMTNGNVAPDEHKQLVQNAYIAMTNGQNFNRLVKGVCIFID